MNATMLHLPQPRVWVARQGNLDAAAHLMPPPGVRHPDAIAAVSEAI